MVEEDLKPAPPARPGSLPVFLVVAYGVTWACWLPLLVSARRDGLDRMPALYFVASAGPLAGAVAASWWNGGRRGVRAWAVRAYRVRLPRVWWLAALGMPVAYAAIGWISAFVVDGSWPALSELGRTGKLPGLGPVLVALVWVATFGVGEESGWRGWLLPALAARMSTFWAATAVGVVWIGWHLPAFWFNPTYTEMGWAILGWMIALLAGSYLLGWMAWGAGWSVLPVLVWHAGFDLLTAADQSSGVIASSISAVVMVQGAVAAGILWRRRAGLSSPEGRPPAAAR